jgi:hypothetical protein
MDDKIDLLKLKIEKARAQLSEETINAIDSVNWQAAILKMRETKGYSFEQLGDLEIETELLLCGLIGPENYPKELESRMKISKTEVTELVNEMNDLVFKKIREELVRSTERNKISIKKEEEVKDDKISKDILGKAGIEILDKKETLPVSEKLELKTTPDRSPSTDDVGLEKKDTTTNTTTKETHPILAQKISSSMQTGIIKTEYSLDNMSKTNTPNEITAKPKIPSADPYREVPE